MVSISKEQYKIMAQKASPDSKSAVDILKAFFIGGLICCIGQLFTEVYLLIGLPKADATIYTSMTLIVITAILTGFGIFGKIAKHAGAGTLVPITGFANATVAPALEFKSEGFVLGLGAKIFIISGPVILYGTAAAFVYGIIYYVFK
jgi:stage V sporulation protein AC